MLITEEDKDGESNITKEFDAILKDIKDNGKTVRLISVKSHGNNIDLHPLMINLLNAEKMVLEKDYRFDEGFNTFDETDNKPNKSSEYKPRIKLNKINAEKCNARVIENYRK